MGARQRIRDAATRLLLSDHVEAMNHTLRVMEAAYQRGPAVMDEQQLITALGEADSYLIDYVMRQRNYQLLTQVDTEYSEDDRRRAVEEARRMYMRDVQSAHAVNLWTDFGFGQKVSVVPEDEGLAKVWNEFWTATRNAPLLKQRRLHKMSNTVINDGETFFIFFSPTVGDGSETTIRRMDTKAVSKIIYEEDDPDIPLYYVRRKGAGLEEVWYPDWRATEEQLARFELPTNAELITDSVMQIVVNGKLVSVTSVKVLHAAYDELNGRGWPLMMRMYAWSRVLKDFLGDRAAVARRVAMFVDRIRHKGGSRAQDAIQSTFQSLLDQNTYLDSNPPAPAGSTAVHDEAVDWYRQPLTSGAGDAMSDGQMFAGQVSVGANIPVHWMGWPQSLANRATAREMARPTIEALERYQNFWADIFRDMVEIIGINAGGYEDYTTDVTLDVPLDTDVEEISVAMGAVTDALAAGGMDTDLGMAANDAMTKRMLQVIGEPTALEGIESEEKSPERVLFDGLSESIKAGRATEDEVEKFLQEEGLFLQHIMNGKATVEEVEKFLREEKYLVR